MNESLIIKFLLGLTSVAYLTMGILLFVKAFRPLQGRMALGLSINASLWSFAGLMVISVSSYDDILFWIRFAFAVVAFIPSFIYALACTFQEEERIYPYKRLRVFFVLSFLVAGLSLFTPAIIQSLAGPLEEKNIVYGALFPLYLVFIVGLIATVLYIILKQIRSSRGQVRNQLRYFFGGIILAFLMGTILNIFLPMVGFATVEMRTIGPLAPFISIIATTVAILKYRLMDIHMALRKFIAYAAAIIVLAVIFILPIFALERTVGMSVEDSSVNYIYLIIVVVLVAMFFQPLHGRVQSFVDRYFYGGVYDYFKILREANSSMVSILNREKLFEFLASKVVDAIYSEGAVFYLQETGGNFVPVTEKNLENSTFRSKKPILEPKNPLLQYLAIEGEILLKQDLRGLPQGWRMLLEKEMEILEAELAAPLFMENKLSGVFILGHKHSGELYTNEDEKLLYALLSQAAISLKNASLYQEVLDVKQHLENVLENMGNGLIAVDGKGRITTFNSAAERITGLKTEDVLGSVASEVLDSRLDKLLMETIKKIRSFKNVELSFSKGESINYYSCSTTIERPEAGETGAILVISDITTIKELEKEKSHAQRLASLGEVAAGMAHEIKNPLVSIKTFAELLPQKYNNPEFRNVFSGIVIQEIERINNLLLELLNFTRDSQVTLQEVDMCDLLDETLLMLHPRVSEQSINIVKQYETSPFPVKVDRNQIKQALFNICLNGIQAMPEGGELKVNLQKMDINFRKEEELLEGDKTIITISDTGGGIPQEIKEKVFDPFFTTKDDGVGIGLSISHKILQAHGGNINLNSNGAGTTFEISIPVSG